MSCGLQLIRATSALRGFSGRVEERRIFSDMSQPRWEAENCVPKFAAMHVELHTQDLDKR